MRRVLAVIGVSACAAVVACGATTSPSSPKPVPGTPFSRVQAAPVVDDERYEGCRWSTVTYRKCSGIADIRETVQVCNACLSDADCSSGGRCVDAFLPGPDVIPIRACAAPESPCFTDGSCPAMNACTVVDASVVCTARELCVAA